MKNFLRGWGFSRILRLVAGAAILGYGFMNIDWALIIFGSMIAIMGITNTGCGPFSNSCEIDPEEKDSSAGNQQKVLD